MTTRIHTQIQLFGLGCEVTIEADSAQAARSELELLQGGTAAPNAQAASQTAPAATQIAQPTPTAATAPAPAAAASATPTATPPSTPAPTTTAAAPEPTSGEDLIAKATELLGREGGEAYLTWALQQIGAATVGTTPPEKKGELLAHIKKGLGEA